MVGLAAEAEVLLGVVDWEMEEAGMADVRVRKKGRARRVEESIFEAGDMLVLIS